MLCPVVERNDAGSVVATGVVSDTLCALGAVDTEWGQRRPPSASLTGSQRVGDHAVALELRHQLRQHRRVLLGRGVGLGGVLRNEPGVRPATEERDGRRG